VGVARIEPERRLEELWHRWEKALAGEVEIVGEPALGHEEADELLGGLDVVAVLESDGGKDGAFDRKGLAVRAEWPFYRRGVPVVVVRTLALQRVGNRASCSAS
jgi:hypothetical protein